MSDFVKDTNVPTNDSISRRAAIDALERKKDKNAKGDIGGFYNKIIQNDIDTLMQMPSAQPEPSEITDEQAILHLQSTGWMQNHDKQMYEMGLKEKLADDSDAYDSLVPSAQPQRWISVTERLPEEAGLYLVSTECGAVFDRWFSYGTFDYTDDEVVAWMPLPEPYKGENDESKSH